MNKAAGNAPAKRKTMYQERYQVRLLPRDVTFTTDGEQTVLEAALNAGIAFPNRCQVGACAMCLCRKLSGTIRYDLEPMLTEKEQEEAGSSPVRRWRKVTWCLH